MDSPERVCKCRVWKLGIPQNATIPCVAGLPHVMKSSDWSIPNDQSALRESDSFEIQQRVSVIETLRSAERKVLIRVLWYSAARSRHVHDEQDPIATCIRRNIVACFTDTIWKIEYTPWENSHSVNSLIETQYTPRCCSRDDRILTRKYDRCPNPPEWDGCKQPGKVASLTTFDTTWGHLLHQLITRIFKPCLHDWILYLTGEIKRSTSKRRAWDLDGMVKTLLDHRLESLPSEWKKCMETQLKYKWNPICAYPVQAYIEADVMTTKAKIKISIQFPVNLHGWEALVVIMFLSI